MRIRFLRLTVVAALASLSLVPAPAVAGESAPRLRDHECGLLIPGGVSATCHTLVVPEDWARPRAKTIELEVMVLESRSATPEPDPVVFLSGGPGDPGIEGFENFVTSPMLENRDIVLFDQRGTGRSGPSLDCPERAEAAIDTLSRADAHADELAALVDATVACRERLVEEGVNLDAYNTKESAADVAALREALQLDEWNLYGVAYGTRLALETMRSFPEGIRSVVLDSVYPPDVGGLELYTDGAGAALDRLVAACDADADCSVLQPDLGQTIQAVVDRYNDAPVDVTLSSGETFVVTGDDIYTGLFDAMYDTDLIPTLPTVIESFAAGDTGLLEVLAEQGIPALATPSKGMFLSVECADAAKFANAKREAKEAEKPGPSSVLVRFAAQPYCDVWDVEPLPDSFSRPVRSKIPTLVLAGSLDPITPAADSKRTAKLLKNAQYFEFAGFGHAVTKGTDCPRAIRQVFLDDPDVDLSVSPEAACAKDPAPGFLSQGLI
ncbi:MAG: alpha/beta fold hydrolase [Acidimicrobiia bacterium]